MQFFTNTSLLPYAGGIAACASKACSLSVRTRRAFRRGCIQSMVFNKLAWAALVIADANAFLPAPASLARVALERTSCGHDTLVQQPTTGSSGLLASGRRVVQRQARCCIIPNANKKGKGMTEQELKEEEEEAREMEEYRLAKLAGWKSMIKSGKVSSSGRTNNMLQSRGLLSCDGQTFGVLYHTRLLYTTVRYFPHYIHTLCCPAATIANQVFTDDTAASHWKELFCSHHAGAIQHHSWLNFGHSSITLSIKVLSTKHEDCLHVSCRCVLTC